MYEASLLMPMMERIACKSRRRLAAPKRQPTFRSQRILCSKFQDYVHWLQLPEHWHSLWHSHRNSHTVDTAMGTAFRLRDLCAACLAACALTWTQEKPSAQSTRSLLFILTLLLVGRFALTLFLVRRCVLTFFDAFSQTVIDLASLQELLHVSNHQQ